MNPVQRPIYRSWTPMSKARKTKRRRRLPRITQRLQRLIIQELRAIAEEAFGDSMETWAKRARLAPETVYRLLRGETRFPQFNTLVVLADVVGQELYLQDRGVAVLRSRQPKGQRRSRKLETVLK